MTKWIIGTVLIVAGLILGYFFRNIENIFPTSAPVVPNTIVITHAFKDGVHHYAGKLHLPHSCYAPLTPEVLTNPQVENSLVLSLVTKDNLLNEHVCFQVSTDYSFEVVAPAPENALVSLRVNGVDTPVNLVETKWQDPKGTILNLENIPK